MSWSACSLEKTTRESWATSWRPKPTRWALPIWGQAPAQGFCLLKSTFSLPQLLVWGQVLGFCDCNRSSLSKDELNCLHQRFPPSRCGQVSVSSLVIGCGWTRQLFGTPDCPSAPSRGSSVAFCPRTTKEVWRSQTVRGSWISSVTDQLAFKCQMQRKSYSPNKDQSKCCDLD